MAKRIIPSVRGRAAMVPSRRTAAEIVQQEATWHPVSSSWVKRIRFIRRSSVAEQGNIERASERQFGDLDVEYKSGAQCRYAEPRSMFLNFLRAGSPGKFVHRNLYKEPYTLLKAGTKKARAKGGRRKSWR